MFKNVWTFNEPGSKIYKGTLVFYEVVKTKWRSQNYRFSHQVVGLQYEESNSGSNLFTVELLQDVLWQLYACERNYTMAGGMVLSELLLMLPSKRELPDYYSVVHELVLLKDGQPLELQLETLGSKNIFCLIVNELENEVSSLCPLAQAR